MSTPPASHRLAGIEGARYVSGALGLATLAALLQAPYPLSILLPELRFSKGFGNRVYGPAAAHGELAATGE